MAAYEQKQPPQQQHNFNANGFNNMICFICDQPFEDSTSPTWERWRKLDEDRRAHPNCFKCDMCSQPITGKYHETKEGAFLCLDNGCVKKHFGDNTKIVSGNYKSVDESHESHERYCFICQQKLIGSYMADSDNNKYHKECFKCNQCEKGLANDPGFIRDGDILWCKNCRIIMKTKEQQQINKQKNSNPNYPNQSPFGKAPPQQQYDSY
eukprot:UN01974